MEEIIKKTRTGLNGWSMAFVALAYIILGVTGEWHIFAALVFYNIGKNFRNESIFDPKHTPVNKLFLKLLKNNEVKRSERIAFTEFARYIMSYEMINQYEGRFNPDEIANLLKSTDNE